MREEKCFDLSSVADAEGSSEVGQQLTSFELPPAVEEEEVVECGCPRCYVGDEENVQGANKAALLREVLSLSFSCSFCLSLFTDAYCVCVCARARVCVDVHTHTHTHSRTHTHTRTHTHGLHTSPS